jgi:hypothetical protein
MGKNGLNSIPEFGELGPFEDAVRKIELSDDLTALQKKHSDINRNLLLPTLLQQLMLEKQVMRYSE